MKNWLNSAILILDHIAYDDVDLLRSFFTVIFCCHRAMAEVTPALALSKGDHAEFRHAPITNHVTSGSAGHLNIA